MALWLEPLRRLSAGCAVLAMSLALAIGQIPLEGGHGPLGHARGAAAHHHAGHHDAGLADDATGHDHAGPLGGVGADHCNSVLCTPTLGVLRAAPVSLDIYSPAAFTIAHNRENPRPVVLDRDPPIPRLSA